MASTKKSKEEKEKEQKKNKKSEERANTKSPSKKTPAKSQQGKKKIKKISNGTTNQHEGLTVPSSSCDSQEVQQIGEENEKRGEINNGNTKSSKVKKSNMRKLKEKDDDGEEGEDGTMCRFPMARIKRIIKSEDPDLQLSRDVVFLVNKATEKFLEQFCDEAYQCSVWDRKKSLGYNHLASVVSKRRRFDFLSDFVPEKLKAKDALAQRTLAETGQGS